jgi:hypothetical protein
MGLGLGPPRWLSSKRLDERGDTKLRGLLEAGVPCGELRMAWHAG